MKEGKMVRVPTVHMQGNDPKEILCCKSGSYSGSFGFGSGPLASRIVLSKKCKIEASDCLKN
jgi:hypothetical protein